MNLPWIFIGITALLIILILIFFIKKNKGKSNISQLAGIAFIFVISGIIFGDNRFFGYGLMGIGIILAIIDIVISRKGGKNEK